MKKLLRNYSKKRDFKVTKEPKGSEKASRKKTLKKAKEPIFVVQEHHASHLHYDFRLELDGVLKSWAIPKGPSMHHDEKRLAIEVEDHPLEYAGFHGTIPEGEYGAGEVYIWDKGTWKGKGEPHEGLKKGKLEFSLKGKKLRGDFVLVKMPSREKSKSNWLLMKSKDKQALSGPEERAATIASSKEQKSPRLKKWPGFIAPQLCLLVDTPPKEKRYVHEIKFDGYRLQPHIKDGKVKLFTRSGIDWKDKFPTIVNAILDLKVDNAILDGEVIIQDKEGKSNFGLLQDALSREDDSNVKIFLFDCFFLNGEDLRGLPLKERKAKLKKIIPPKHNVIKYSEDVSQNGESFFRLTCKHNLEGIVSKDSTAPYFGGRSRLWCKAKCSERQELVIGGYTTGKGNRAAEIGALLLGVYDKNKFRYVGKVGTGFNRQTLHELKEKVSRLEQQRSAFDIRSPEGKQIHWLKPKLVAEVSFTEWTNDSLLRHPVFVGLREDKKNMEIVMEKEEVSLTHPKKILFAEEKITKEQIADYYNTVARFMLPYTENRPLSLLRCPNGSNKECFYQKRPGQGQESVHFKSFKVKEKNKVNVYFAIDSKEGLKQLVQMNAFEIHVWNCHYENLSNPDQIVLDFDPDLNVNFKQVVSAALEMKKILDKLKLKSFVKITGGKGLHIHIPIKPLYSWEEIKSFSKALADEMVSRNPKLYLSNMSKERRKGKIFVDYFRNNFGATAIAPYSLRAKNRSSVAMPLEWKELGRIKSADQFTLKKALRKIKTRKVDPWKKFFSCKQKIHILD